MKRAYFSNANQMKLNFLKTTNVRVENTIKSKFMLGANMSGIEKLKLFVICKEIKLECFKGIKSLKVD